MMFKGKKENAITRDKRTFDTEQFIDEFRHEESLWNSALGSYKNKHDRQNALERIAAKLGLTNTEVKSKINNLRTYYAKELSKERERDLVVSSHASEHVTTYESKWPHFESLRFLKHLMSHRNAHPVSEDGRDNDMPTFVNFGNNNTTSEMADEHLLTENNSNPAMLSTTSTTTFLPTQSFSTSHSKRSDVVTSDEEVGSTTSRKRLRASTVYTPTEDGAFHNRSGIPGYPENKDHPMASYHIPDHTNSSKINATYEQCDDRLGKHTNTHKLEPLSKTFDDPEDIFGRHVACQLRSFQSQRERDYLKFKVEELIFQVKFNGVPSTLSEQQQQQQKHVIISDVHSLHEDSREIQKRQIPSG